MDANINHFLDDFRKSLDRAREVARTQGIDDDAFDDVLIACAGLEYESERDVYIKGTSLQ